MTGQERSAVKTHASHTEDQNPHSSSQLTVTPAPGALAPNSSLQRWWLQGWWTNMHELQDLPISLPAYTALRLQLRATTLGFLYGLWGSELMREQQMLYPLSHLPAVL